jgi:hypothetical protein
MTPAWILDIFAALMVVVAAVSAARLVAARPWQRGSVVTDTDIAHLLMAIAMAGMLASSLTTLPDGAWEVVFGLMTVWFAYRVVRDARANGVRALAGGHCAPHLVHSAAMLYMFLALAAPAASGGSGMSGMGASSGSAMRTLSYPTLALVLGLVLAGYSVWDLDQLSGTRHAFANAPVKFAGAALANVLAPAAAQPSPVTGAVRDSVVGNSAISDSAIGNSAVRDSAVRDSAVGDPRHTAAEAVPADSAAASASLLSPGVTVGCRIAMGVTMALMLFLMI